MYTTEAATELLIRAFEGRFAAPGNPWIQPTNHGYWIDFAGMAGQVGALAGGEQRLLRLAASIGSGEVMVNLGEEISGMDRATAHLVLAAVAHAAGTHEQSEMVIDPTTGGYLLVGQSCLYGWDDPATEEATT